MIAPLASAIPTGPGGFGPGVGRAGRWGVVVDVRAAAAPRRAAPPPRPRACAASLEGLLTDGSALRVPNRTAAAARAFSAGDGFLPGQIIDRSI